MGTMNPIQRTLILSLMPAFAPLTMAAETPPSAQPTKSAEEAASNPPWRASKIIGTQVKNATDQVVGEVEDLIVDFKSGEILGVVVESGGFLGVADTLSTLPTSSLRYDSKNQVFLTALTQEQLKKAPQFKKAAWLETHASQLGTKLREFRDSIGGDVTAPDNSAQNEKDGKSDAPTPMDQGSSDEDLRITKNIRAAIIDADLSFNSKNIKVITQGGKVTLRGVVSTAEEHKTILAIAKQHVDPAAITDETEVKSK
jgi:hypothetical protein